MTPKPSSLPKALVVGVTFTVALVAFAASRKVTIPVTKSGLQILNGSSVSVTYNLNCYGTNGAVAFTSNGLTLASHGAKEFGSDEACSGSHYSGTSSWPNGMGLCGSPVTRPSSESQCGNDYHVCSVSEVVAGLGGAWPTQGWVSTNGFNSTWAFGYTSDTSFWSGGDINLQFANNEYPIAASTGNYCATGPGTNGTVYNSCGRAYSGATHPTYCCPNSPIGNVTHCTVEIDSSTPAGGYLQSPQFKGSAPF